MNAEIKKAIHNNEGKDIFTKIVNDNIIVAKKELIENTLSIHNVSILSANNLRDKKDYSYFELKNVFGKDLGFFHKHYLIDIKELKEKLTRENYIMNSDIDLRSLKDGIHMIINNERKNSQYEREFLYVAKESNAYIIIVVREMNYSYNSLARHENIYNSYVINGKYGKQLNYTEMRNLIKEMEDFKYSEELKTFISALNKKFSGMKKADKELIKKFYGEEYFNFLYTPIIDNDELCVRVEKPIDNYGRSYYRKVYVAKMKDKAKKDVILEEMLSYKYSVNNSILNKESRLTFEYEEGYAVLSSWMDNPLYFIKTKYGDIEYCNNAIYGKKISNTNTELYNKYCILRAKHTKDLKLMLQLENISYADFYNRLKKGE